MAISLFEFEMANLVIFCELVPKPETENQSSHHFLSTFKVLLTV
jgi:hypothetical protein